MTGLYIAQDVEREGRCIDCGTRIAVVHLSVRERFFNENGRLASRHVEDRGRWREPCSCDTTEYHKSFRQASMIEQG